MREIPLYSVCSFSVYSGLKIMGKWGVRVSECFREWSSLGFGGELLFRVSGVGSCLRCDEELQSIRLRGFGVRVWGHGLGMRV